MASLVLSNFTEKLSHELNCNISQVLHLLSIVVPIFTSSLHSLRKYVHMTQCQCPTWYQQRHMTSFATKQLHQNLLWENGHRGFKGHMNCTGEGNTVCVKLALDYLGSGQ